MIQFPRDGGCFCGDVRYTLKAAPLTLYACHCKDCQRQTGTSFVLSMWIRREALELVKGDPKEYDCELPDGRRKRGWFCGRCSTRLWGEPPSYPGLAVLRPGTLDDTSWVHPVAHIWTRSAQPWVRIPEDTLTFSGQPQEDGVTALLREWRCASGKRVPRPGGRCGAGARADQAGGEGGPGAGARRAQASL